MGYTDYDRDGHGMTQAQRKSRDLALENLNADVLCTDWGEIEAKPLSLIGEGEGIEKRPVTQAGVEWAKMATL